jgi:hypothetical protein
MTSTTTSVDNISVEQNDLNYNLVTRPFDSDIPNLINPATLQYIENTINDKPDIVETPYSDSLQNFYNYFIEPNLFILFMILLVISFFFIRYYFNNFVFENKTIPRKNKKKKKNDKITNYYKKKIYDDMINNRSIINNNEPILDLDLNITDDGSDDLIQQINFQNDDNYSNYDNDDNISLNSFIRSGMDGGISERDRIAQNMFNH